MPTNPKLLEGKIDRTKIDYLSSTFRELIRYLEFEIEKLRKDNDNPALTPEQTFALRGRIAENKGLVSKLKPPQTISTEKMTQR